jgi:hypothetical protein
LDSFKEYFLGQVKAGIFILYCHDINIFDQRFKNFKRYDFHEIFCKDVGNQEWLCENYPSLIHKIVDLDPVLADKYSHLIMIGRL